MEQESPHLGRCSSGKAELEETVWSKLLPRVTPPPPQCNELEGVQSPGLCGACASKSTYPVNLTAGTGATPGSRGRLQALPSGSAVVGAVQGCGTQCMSHQRVPTVAGGPCPSLFPASQLWSRSRDTVV